MRALPPSFDPAHYRAANPALATLSDEAAAEHFAREGRAAGLVASPLALRENLLALAEPDARVLEIGPFDAPLMHGPDVRYLDLLDAEGLRARAIEIGRDPAGCPDPIHYVGGLETVDTTFDYILSSHSIEHQPDLVAHLRDIERVLAPGGAYLLIVPDKRYCFDHFIAESTIADLLEAWHVQRRTHRLGSVIEHRALTTHNEALRHWQGDHGEGPRVRKIKINRAIGEFEAAAGGYLDVHAWYFTPDSFRVNLEGLHGLGLTKLFPVGVYDTAYGRNEFCAVLQVMEG